MVRPSLDRRSGVDQLAHGLESGRAVSDAGREPPQLQPSLIRPCSRRSSTTSAGGRSASSSRTPSTRSVRSVVIAPDALSRLPDTPDPLTHAEAAWRAGIRWAVPGSNQRPPGCKPGALPTELTALLEAYSAADGRYSRRRCAVLLTTPISGCRSRPVAFVVHEQRSIAT